MVLLDTDIGLRNLDVVMGLENRIVYDIVDVVEGTCRLKQALIKDKRYTGFVSFTSSSNQRQSLLLLRNKCLICVRIKAGI